MASPEAFDAVKDTLVDQWTVTPVVYENDRYSLPPKATTFVYVVMSGDLYEQASIGADPQPENLWRESGVVDLHVMVPNDSGSREARVLAKALVGLFKGREIDGVVFRDAAIGRGDPGRSFANYWALTASIDFQRDEP